MQSNDGDEERVDDGVEMEDEPDEKMTATTTTIFDMIENHNWDSILATTDTNVLSLLHPQTGQYPLHALCCIGASAVPVELIRHVAASDPAAIAAPDDRYGDTCLHILGRQSSPHTLNETLAVLLPLTPPATIGFRNHFGGTVLHVAVHHNATIDTLALLLRTYPPVIDVRTPERRHAVEILYAGFCATIHGHVHICKLLEYHDAKRSVGGDDDRPQSSIFDRFWNKIRLLALTAFFQSDRSTRPSSSWNISAGIHHHTSDDNDNDDQYLVHGLLLCGDVPDQLLRLALHMVGPAAVLARDVNGNTPLHHYVQKAHRFINKGSSSSSSSKNSKNNNHMHRTVIRALLKRAAGVRNREHFLPLHLAIRDRRPYEDYWGIISLNGGSSNDSNNNDSHDGHNNDRCLQSLDMSDPVTQLPPALLAASLGGKEAVNTCFCLLRNHPEQIKRVVVGGNSVFDEASSS
jgi:ankyrin repeat protein